MSLPRNQRWEPALAKIASYGKIALLVLIVSFVSGCASITRYSIESYQGPFPPNDREHLQAVYAVD